MVLLGFTLLGVLLFLGLVFAVIVGGAFGNKQEKNLRELTERQQAAGITGDVSMNDGYSGEHYGDRPVHA
ncbi:hypothetical protein ACLESO_39020 [Pyxidicoccus sp. 3LG]